MKLLAVPQRILTRAFNFPVKSFKDRKRGVTGWSGFFLLNNFSTDERAPVS